MIDLEVPGALSIIEAGRSISQTTRKPLIKPKVNLYRQTNTGWQLWRSTWSTALPSTTSNTGANP